MKCFYCPNESSAKVGIGKINLIRLLRGRAWQKAEIYVCRKCYETVRDNPNLTDDLR